MTITYDEIAKRAFEIWEKEGRPAGREWDHWFQAETELRLQQQLGNRQEKKTNSMAKSSSPPVQTSTEADDGLDSSANEKKRNKKPAEIKQQAAV